MKLAHHVNVVATKAFAGVITALVGATLLSEAVGRPVWGRPLTVSEMVLLGLCLPGVWIGAYATQWWLEFLEERGL